MKKITKQTMIALVVIFGSPAMAHADDQQCGAQRLNGLYVFSAAGYNIVGGVTVPKALVEVIEFNGDRTLDTPGVTVSIDGNLLPPGHPGPGSSGHYDLGIASAGGFCIGAVTFNDGNQFDLYLSPNGNEGWMIQTNAIFATGAVFQGKLERVPRWGRAEGGLIIVAGETLAATMAGRGSGRA